jgi:hypothetical protein
MQSLSKRLLREKVHLELSHQVSSMLWFKRDKERHRFYLLPGMGGRAARRKHNKMLQWSIVIGLLASAVLAMLLYFVNRMGK